MNKDSGIFKFVCEPLLMKMFGLGHYSVEYANDISKKLADELVANYKKENDTSEKFIKLIQNNLQNMRIIAGWTASFLGEKLNVTKQAISNIENNKSRLSISQALNIYMLLNMAYTTNERNNKYLGYAIVIINNVERLSEKEIEGVSKQLAQLAGAIKLRLDQDIIDDICSKFPLIGGKTIEEILKEKLE